MHRLLVVVGVIAAMGGCGKTAEKPAPASKKDPETKAELSPQAVRTWLNAGIGYGGLKGNADATFILDPRDPPDENTGSSIKADEIPAFHVRGQPKTSVVELPTIGVPFGIIFDNRNNRSLEKVSGELVQGLSRHKQLRMLAFWGTTIEPPGFAELGKLRGLQALSFSETPVSDEQLRDLAGLGALKLLDVGVERASGISDEGLKVIAKLSELEGLNLIAARVTDRGFKELTGLKKLRHLNLGGTQVTDESVKQLAAFPHLETVHLHGLKISRSVVDKLKKARPKLSVEVDS